jgi:hypothetical protein
MKQEIMLVLPAQAFPPGPLACGRVEPLRTRFTHALTRRAAIWCGLVAQDAA